MFSEADVRELLRDKRLRPPVASFYLNTDRGHTEGERYHAAFRTLVHEADRLLRRTSLPDHSLGRARLQEALPEVFGALEAAVAKHSVIRGVAVFVSLAPAPDEQPFTPPFTLFTLPRPLRNQVRVERRPFIRPLLFLLDQYERVGAIVADRNHARILTLFLGELEYLHHRDTDTPQRHAQGGWKQILFQRDVEGHVKAHIRASVREAVNTFGARPLKRLILGGTEEILPLLERELPPRWRAYLAGTFHAAPHASDAEITSIILRLAQEAEQREEHERVREWLELLAHKPGATHGADHQQAVSGLEGTLHALSEQRVRRLILLRGCRHAGYLCDNCGGLFADTSGTCGYCATPLRPVADVLEWAAEVAHEQGAEAEFVTQHPSLEALGGVGAILRF